MFTRITKLGFTLLEIIITIVLFTLGIVAIVGALSIALVGSDDAENTTIAINLAQGRLEEIRNLDFDAGIADEAKAGVAGFSRFQRQVVVTEPETDLKQVTVTIYWTPKGGEANVSLATYISKK